MGWEDPLEKGKATHSSILAWRIPWTVHGVAKRQNNFHFTGGLVVRILCFYCKGPIRELRFLKLHSMAKKKKKKFI